MVPQITPIRCCHIYLLGLLFFCAISSSAQTPETKDAQPNIPQVVTALPSWAKDSALLLSDSISQAIQALAFPPADNFGQAVTKRSNRAKDLEEKQTLSERENDVGTEQRRRLTFRWRREVRKLIKAQASLEQRVQELEEEVAHLRARLDARE